MPPVIPVLRLDTPRDNLQRLWVMRNIALAGQVSVIAFTMLVFRIPLPLTAIVAIVLLLAAFNGFTWLRLRRPHAVHELEILGQFWVDLTALSALLFFTGGATNPFISFYLPILAVAAAALPPRYVWFLSGFSLLCYTVLAFEYLPLDVANQTTAIIYHLAGMWVNFVIGAGWIAWFVLRMSRALRERDAALADARQRLLQDARVVALGAQAARAAHELATPLSTIAVAAGELREAATDDPELDEYRVEIDTIEKQLEQCRAVLATLRGTAPVELDRPVALAQWLPDFLDDWALRHPHTLVERTLHLPNSARCDDPVLLGQVMTILLDNAARASERLTIAAEVGNGSLILAVRDFGPGVPNELRERIGAEPVQSTHGGRGWGLFLAFTAAQSRGGSMALSAAIPNGTVAQVDWPLVSKES